MWIFDVVGIELDALDDRIGDWNVKELIIVGLLLWGEL